MALPLTPGHGGISITAVHPPPPVTSLTPHAKDIHLSETRKAVHFDVE